MYTAFIADTKTALNSLWESVSKIHLQQTRNADSAVYAPAYAESENKKLDAQKKSACNAARDKINAICDRAHEDAASLDMIALTDIEPDSMSYKRLSELLSGRYTLSVEQLQHLIDTYIPQSDRVALNAVRTFAEVRGMRLIAADTASRRSGIASIRESALGVVSKIESTNYKNGGRDFSAPLVVERFCEDGDFASGLYAKLGQKFSGELVPARVEPESAFDFHFRGVRKDEAKAG